MYRFSVLIPTKSRPDTLQYSLKTALNQEFDDFEIVVANNGGDPLVTAVIEQAASPRVREIRTDRLYSMPENWEFGVSNCKGEFITVLGDDDGLMPELMAYADRVISATNTKVFTWPTHLYWWPSALDRMRHNTLHVRGWTTESSVAFSSAATLDAMYNWGVHLSIVPMIYFSFIHRSIIERAQSESKYYFASAAPDNYSAIVNLHYSEAFFRSWRPLGISGISGHSTGGQLGIPEKVEAIYSNLSSTSRKLHPSVFPSRHGILAMVDALAVGRDLMFPDHPTRVTNLMAVVHHLIVDMLHVPEHYDLTLQDILRLAQLNNIDLSSFRIPDKAAATAYAQGLKKVQRHAIGPTLNEQSVYNGLVMDGNICGISDVVGAVRMIRAVTPAFDPDFPVY